MAETSETNEGLHQKYEVTRLRDEVGKHDDCRYFVLDPQHDPLAAGALRAYSEQARRIGLVPLADDLAAWLRKLDYCPACTQVRGHRGACDPRLRDPWGHR